MSYQTQYGGEEMVSGMPIVMPPTENDAHAINKTLE
jgi:hypothetical protein